MSEIKTFPDITERIKTGAVQFGEDYTGLFIRGDECFYISQHLKVAIERLEALKDSSIKTIIAHDGLMFLKEMIEKEVVVLNRERNIDDE